MSGSAPISQLAPKLAHGLSELYRASHAAEFGMKEEAFAAVLDEVAAKYLPGAGAQERLAFLRALKLEELALVRACAAGHERAWEIFLTRYREKLYDAARAITREESSARELADSLYADLYGTEKREGRRRSKLDYYTGRGSLEGWLRATLAQEYVNRYRRVQRLVSLEERTEAGAQFAAPESAPSQILHPQLVEAVDGVLSALAAEERFILASYYLDQRTLAQIARTLGVHESTISRKLEKITRAVRRRIANELVRRGMSERQTQEALATDVRDLAVDVSGRLSQAGGAGPFFNKEVK